MEKTRTAKGGGEKNQIFKMNLSLSVLLALLKGKIISYTFFS